MLRKPFLCALTLILLGAAAAGAVTPYLVKDIDTTGSNAGSELQLLTSLSNGVAFFVANDGISGYGLWRSDGTEGGTWRLPDTCDECTSNTDPARFFANAGDRFFFRAMSAQSGRQEDLWVTGGSADNTVRLTEDLVVPYQFPVWIASRGLLFFGADDGVHGLQLWRTDGTVAGTSRLTDLRWGGRPPVFRELIEFKGRLYFPVNDGVNGPALWTSDGTPAGTRLVRDTWSGRQDHTGPTYLRVAGQRLLFFAEGPGSGFELWASDGTTRGTAPVTELVPGAGSPRISSVVAVGNRVWLIADAGRGEELWVTDGTRSGTRVLTNLAPANAFDRTLFAALGNKVVFHADDGVHGQEPWISDGTRTGTRLLRDICPGSCTSAPNSYSVHGGRLYLSAEDGVRGDELWSSDGTTAGTRLVRDLCPGACPAYPGRMIVVGGRLLFPALDAAPGVRSLWRTNGTARGTLRLASFEWELDGFNMAVLPRSLLLAGFDREHGVELWRSDGTRPGTRLLKDVNSVDIGGSTPHLITRDGNGVIFAASAADASGEVRDGLWRSDGTETGTVRLGDLFPCPSFRKAIAPLSPGVFVFTCLELGGWTLWRGDGTAQGTVEITPPGVRLGYVTPVVTGGRIFFAVDEGDETTGLWVSDGTAGGTRRLTDRRIYPSEADPFGLTVFQGRVWFTASGTYGFDLWASDGTVAGTVQMTHDDVRPAILGEHAGRLWFAGEDTEHGTEVWSTDGTQAGTGLTLDLDPGPSSSLPFRLVSAAGRMFLSVSSSEAGLWVSDGTAAGTHLIAPDPMRRRYIDQTNVAVLGDQVFFKSFISAEFDERLMRSDGTPEGTVPVRTPGGDFIGYEADDLTPFAGRIYFVWRDGLWSTNGSVVTQVPGVAKAGELTVAGPRLFFRATDPIHGMELWALE